MPASVKTYVPKDIQVTLAGNFIVGGIVSIAVSFPQQRFKMVKGILGRNVRVRIPDTSCTVTLELLQTATANDLLSSILDQDTVTGLGRLSLDLSDLSGSTRIGSSNGYVVGFPETTFSGELSTRTWTIQLLNTDYSVVGGNAKQRPKFLNDILDFVSGATQAVGDFTKTVSGLF